MTQMVKMTDETVRSIPHHKGFEEHQPVAMDVQGSLGESIDLSMPSQDDQRASSFLKQRFSTALQIGNAACVLGTVSDRDACEEIYYI